MKRSHLLLIAAASLAPIQAATPQENLAAALTASLDAPKGSEKAPINAGLAQIPAGNDFFSIYHIDTLGQELAKAGLIDEEDADDTPFTSITIASNYAEMGQKMKGIISFYNKLTTLGMLADHWNDISNEQYEDALRKVLSPKELFESPEALAELAQAVKEMEIPPFYITAELTEESVQNIVQLLMQLPMYMADAPEGISCEMEGSKAIITLDLGSLASMDGSTPEPIIKASHDKTITITLELKGSTLQVALGTDRESLKWADSTEQSVLATSAANFLKKPADGKGFLCASMNKDALNRHTTDCAELLSSIFTKLGKAVPENQATFDAAAKSIVQISAAFDAAWSPLNQDLQVIAWFDKGFFAEVSCDFGGNYSPAKMSSLASINEQTAFIMQSAKFDYSKYNFDVLLKVLPQVVPVLNAVGLTLDPAMQDELVALEIAKNLISDPSQCPDEVKTLLDTAAACEPSILAMAKSMGNSYGLSCSVNADPEGDEALVAFAELSNKQQFIDGFSKTYEIINSAVAKFGVAIPPLNIKESQDGPVTSYSLVEDGLTLQASLSEQCISISNVPTVNASMQQSMSSGQGPTFAGAVIYVNLENTVSILDKYELLDDDDDYGVLAPVIIDADGEIIETEDGPATIIEETRPSTESDSDDEKKKTDIGPFRDLIITFQSPEPSSSKGSIRMAMPLK